MLKSVRFGFMLLDFIGQCFFEITQCEWSSFHADLLFFYFFIFLLLMRAEQFSCRFIIFLFFYFFAVICLFLKKGRDVMY